MKLPKPYLSWSQINLWQKYPKQYAKRYFIGERVFSTPEMAFGSKFGECVEHGNLFDTPTEMIETVSNLERMYYYEFPVVIQRDSYYLLGYIDALNKDLSLLHEYKTGKTAWTKDKAEKHGQLKMYSAAIRAYKGFIPDCKLIWFETEGAGEEIKFTGSRFDYPVKYNDTELDDFLNMCDEVAEEISYHYQMFELELV